MEPSLTLHVISWLLVGLALAFVFIPEVLAAPDSDKDGVPDSVDLCPDEQENYNGLEDNDGCLDGVPEAVTTTTAIEEVPPLNVDVEQVGSAFRVNWEYDPSSSLEVESWELKRKATQGGTFKIKEKVLDPDKKIKNPLNATIQIDYVLDTSVEIGNSYQYQIEAAFSNGKKSASNFTDFALVETPNPELFRIKANQIETSSLIPLIDISNIFDILFIDYFPIFPYAYAPNPIPILTSELNPVVPESYLFSLEPIPAPILTIDDCEEILYIDYKRSADFGQTIYILLTIFENNATAYSYLFDATDSDKRIFNEEFDIPLANQTITDYENLELQIDIQAETVLDSNDYRQLSIHGIQFKVPSEDSVC